MLFIRAYNLLIMALAIIAGAMTAIVFVFILVDVTMRTLDFKPFQFVSAVSEYALLYMTMLAAPWLVRQRGHVRIESVATYFPIVFRNLVDRILVVVCALLCLIAAYYSGKLGLDFFLKGVIDIRSIEIPRWLLFLPLTVGFSLCAIEFLRFLHPDIRFTPSADDPAEGAGTA